MRVEVRFLKITEAGYSLVEVMIVVVIMGLLAAGSINLLTEGFRIERRADMNAQLAAFKQRLQEAIKDDEAWRQTVNNYALGSAQLVDCLRDDVTNAHWCQHGTVSPSITVRTRFGGTVYPGENPNAGLTPQGSVCNTFVAPPGAGNDQCPYRYAITTSFRCKGPATCKKPEVVTEATFVANPSNGNILLSNVDTASLSFTVTRNLEIQKEPFTLKFRTPNAPGGGCTAVGARRPLNELEFEAADDASGDPLKNAVTLNGDSTFDLNQGEYSCVVSAQGFGLVNGFFVELVGGGVRHPIGAGWTPIDGSTTVVGNASFIVPPGASQSFQVVTSCPTPFSVFDMGIPVSNYSVDSVYTSVSCVRSL